MTAPPSRDRARSSTSLRARTGGALLALGLLAPFAAAAPAAAVPPPSSESRSSHAAIEPVIDANFPDPDILLVDGVYHAYATNNDGDNVQHATSTDLETWTLLDDVAPVLGDWVGDCSFAPGGATDQCVWAPEVAEVEGGYALYYTARDELSGNQCIGVALSDSPDGPFVPVGDDPLVCPVAERGVPEQGGAIDAATYTEDGRLYLLWKADGNCCTLPAIIYIQELSADGTTFLSEPVELIRNDQPYEGAVVEAPTLVKIDGTYYLFYSANDFYGGNYRTAYATSTSLLGPYTKAETELLTTDRFDEGLVRGPGGQDVVVGPDGELAIVFHGWDPTYSYRAMYLSDLDLTADGVPVVEEASMRYQAEDGVVVNARVVGDASASGGEKVGGLDFEDSSVTVEVYAEKAGPATLRIRYANGSYDGAERVEATSSLTINGEDAGTVTFAHTTWGNWQILEEDVRLEQGWNTITLTKETYFVEIDAFDIDDAGHPEADPAGPPADPTTADRYEAEDGVVVNARIRDDGAASGGQVVGGMDFPDSSITWEVCVDKAGPATLAITYANGSERGGYPLEATDLVTVNGRDAGTVTFDHTRWGNWQVVEHDVHLKKGCNTVTLTRGTWYAEIDAVDVY